VLLLLRLLVAEGQPVSDTTLLEDVWEARLVRSSVVKSAVNRLRHHLGAGSARLVRRSTGYALDLTDVVIDAKQFEQLLGNVDASGGDAEAIERLDEALAMWRGSPFGSFGELMWLVPITHRLTNLRDGAIDERFERLLRIGAASSILPDLTAALSAEPYRERRAEFLVRALYQTGQPVEALGSLRACMARLRADLGIEPSERLVRLEHMLLNHDPTLSAPKVREIGRLDTLVSSIDALRKAGASVEAARVTEQAVSVARRSSPQSLARELSRQAVVLALAERGTEAKVALDEAEAVARSRHDSVSLAQVAMTRFGFGVGSDGDDLLVQLLEPLDTLTPDAAERVELLCAAMCQIIFSADSHGAEALVQRAAEAASSTSDERLIRFVGAARNILDAVRDIPLIERLLNAELALSDAAAIDEPALTITAQFGWVRAQFDAGRISTVAEFLPVFRVAARATTFPFTWIRPDAIDIALRLACADLDNLEAEISELRARGERMGLASIGRTTNLLLAGYWLERDALVELRAATTDDSDPTHPALWQTLHAMIAAVQGSTDARAVLDGIEASRPWERHHGWMAAFMAAFTIEAAAIVGHAGSAAAALPLLDALGGRSLVAGHAVFIAGPIDRLRGLGQFALGDLDAAVDHLRSAREQASLGGASVWADRCGVNLCSALQARRGQQDRHEAVRLLREVATAGRSTGSPRLARELAAATEQARVGDQIR
jgi:DNA-binding SARP family transcriptional activator